MVALAKEFNVDRATIIRIIYGRINNYEEKPNFARRNDGKQKLTKEQVKEIKKKLRQGKQQIILAKIFNVSPSHISKINTGEKRKDIENKGDL